MLLLAVSLGSILGPFNANMLAVALPDIRAEFGLSHSAIGWLVSMYLVGMTVSQPVLGRLGDQVGRNRVFQTALCVFLVSALVAATAPSYPVLVAARIGQAVSGGALMPNALAMLRETVPVERLGRMYGLNGSVTSLAAVMGPIVAAVVLAVAPWRWLLYGTVPVVAISLLLLRYSRYRPSAARTSVSIDWGGAALYAGVLASVAILWSSIGDGDMRMVIGPALVLVPLGLAFGYRLRTSFAPVIQWRLLSQRSFAAASVQGFATTIIIYSTVIATPFFVREVLEASSSSAGLILGAMFILSVLAAPVSGRAADSVGRRLPCLIGGVIATIGLVLVLFGMRADVSSVYLATALALVGLGTGLSSGPATTAAVESAPRRFAGEASGTLSAIRFMGALLGASTLASLLSTGSEPTFEAFQVIFFLLVCAGVVATIAAAYLHVFPEKE